MEEWFKLLMEYGIILCILLAVWAVSGWKKGIEKDILNVENQIKTFEKNMTDQIAGVKNEINGIRDDVDRKIDKVNRKIDDLPAKMVQMLDIGHSIADARTMREYATEAVGKKKSQYK